MRETFDPAAAGRARDLFRAKYVDVFADQFPDLVSRMKAQRYESEDSKVLTLLMGQSPEMRLAVCLHLAKYSPPGSQAKAYADYQVDRVTENWFRLMPGDGSFFTDGILAFMADRPDAFEQYAEIMRSWEDTTTILARMKHASHKSDEPPQFGL